MTSTSTAPWFLYREFDLTATGLLPNQWYSDILDIVQRFERKTILDGNSITSREPAGNVQIEVGVVTGDVIRSHLPWLFALYQAELCDLASQAAEYRVYPSNDLASSVNINVLRGQAARYEWHVDSNPLTGLLFVTTHTAEDGGELMFQQGNQLALVRPVTGRFIAFDARQVPHTVLPLKRDGVRISIPVNFYASSAEQSRPADLDGYLYTARI